LNREEGIICLKPSSSCETYVPENTTCFNDAKTLCLNWRFIFWAIFLGNFLQVIFETALLYALEITFKPTELDKLSDPEGFDMDLADQNNPD
jgi:hypothetical protein